jgi:regulator of cell morphogenesis and NO signaling
MNTTYIFEDAAEANRNYKMPGEQNKKSVVFPEGRMPIALSNEQCDRDVSKPKQKVFNNDLEGLEIETLIEHIIDKHHNSSRKNATIIYDLSQKVAYEHGRNHPEIKQLASSMFLFLHDYLNNQKKEEQIVFPNIRVLVHHNVNFGKGGHTTFGLLRESIKMIKEDHQSTAEYLRLFNELTDGYSLPADAGSGYKALFETLKEFEADFVLHSYVETKILFPKALAKDQST